MYALTKCIMGGHANGLSACRFDMKAKFIPQKWSSRSQMYFYLIFLNIEYTSIIWLFIFTVSTKYIELEYSRYYEVFNVTCFYNNYILFNSDPDDDSFASERDVQPTDDLVTSFVFNRNHSVSIQAQREQLPIFAHRDQILYSLEHYQTLVLVGETGCGKSTQVPQVCFLLLVHKPQCLAYLMKVILSLLVCFI